jgi:hypothetical protein
MWPGYKLYPNLFVPEPQAPPQRTAERIEWSQMNYLVQNAKGLSDGEGGMMGLWGPPLMSCLEVGPRIKQGIIGLYLLGR